MIVRLDRVRTIQSVMYVKVPDDFDIEKEEEDIIEELYSMLDENDVIKDDDYECRESYTKHFDYEYER